VLGTEGVGQKEVFQVTRKLPKLWVPCVFIRPEFCRVLAYVVSPPCRNVHFGLYTLSDEVGSQHIWGSFYADLKLVSTHSALSASLLAVVVLPSLPCGARTCIDLRWRPQSSADYG
jgi:MFS-type transporter involved in bile tolerance (Atg22 family)